MYNVSTFREIHTMAKPTILNPLTKKPIIFEFEIGDRNDQADASYVYLVTVPDANDRFDIGLCSLRKELVGLDTFGNYIDSRSEEDSISEKLCFWPGPLARDADCPNPCVYLHSNEIAVFFEEPLTSEETQRLNDRLNKYMSECKITKYQADFIETQQPSLTLAIVETSSLQP